MSKMIIHSNYGNKKRRSHLGHLGTGFIWAKNCDAKIMHFYIKGNANFQIHNPYHAVKKGFSMQPQHWHLLLITQVQISISDLDEGHLKPAYDSNEGS